ncbi:hypothetical protein N825_03310 [Skermanella stibiiresistens SB22]|jgi:hypothetical protein|uniref:Lipoprotein n=1 Tax=Skermanella stibiiresistens SB22 TaxID=1385369 RepID=W9H1U2_9PROT|nr:hypothetical protein [Skermanella stibiiresistens]EWY40130.1 hypothetical protein N825_03310 [Skermanella stibiiresistens SB22]
MNAHRIGAALAALFLLAACDDYGRVTQTQVDPGYNPGELGYAGGKDATLTTLIYGNPSDVNAALFTQQVLTSMNRVQAGPGLKFAQDAGPGGQPLYKVVMVFNPESQVIDAELCAAQIPPSQPFDKDISVRAAYCRGGRALTGAIGTIKADVAAKPDRMDRFIRDLTFTLFPLNRG